MTDAAVRPFPWGQVLHLGLGRLRLDPKSFWAATPREIFAALGGHVRNNRSPGRDDLARLMTAFPDQPITTNGGLNAR